MFLHIGGNMAIPWADIVGIFDLKALDNPEGEAVLNKAKQEGRLRKTLAKSTNAYVVTSKHIYTSAIKASTLRGRVESLRYSLM